MPEEDPQRRPRSKGLNSLLVQSLNRPGRYADGDCLYLVIAPGGSKQWVSRVTVQGRRREIGLGSVRTVSLREARDQALEVLRTARRGGDPLAERRAAAQRMPSFRECSRALHAELVKSWSNDKHSKQWISTLENYVYPHFGDMPINQIDSSHILKALTPIWNEKPDTAKRIKQRVLSVFDWAKAKKYFEKENPVFGVSRALPKQQQATKHHTALPYGEVRDFIDRVKKTKSGPIAKLSLILIILTACRTKEVLEARWSEFNLEKNIWTIPPERMKTRKAHRIPLSPTAVQVILEAREISLGSEYLFLGRSKVAPPANMIFLNLIRRLGFHITTHGFRSTFRDWASDQTNFPDDVCEMALAHAVKGKTERAYKRSDLFDKRRELMFKWDMFIFGGGSNQA